MDVTLKLWIVIVAVGCLNYLSRLSFIALFARRSMPPLLARALKYVPAAMLTALILPMVVTAPTAPSAPMVALPAHIDARVLAFVIAGVVAFRTRSTLMTLGVGMMALWLIQAIAAVPGLGR